MLPGHSLALDTLSPVNFKGQYEFSFAKIPFGKMGIEAEQTADQYAITSDIASTGALNLFVKHKSHTAVAAKGKNFAYSDIAYETNYSTKKKKRYVKLVYKNDRLQEEIIQPPDSRRPTVADELKNKALDPLSFLLAMRKNLYAANKNNQDKFSIDVFDGRRLTRAFFTIEGKKTIDYQGKSLPVIAMNVRRELLAGFTNSELSDHNPNEPTLHVYFSDDEHFLPIKLEATLWLNTLSATLVKECTKGESCLFGLTP